MNGTGDRPMIQVRGLVKSFGRKVVLRGIDLDMPAGQTLALFGPNGAGKTTFIRILATLSKATAGEVCIGGVELSRAGSELRRYIGLVSHAPLVYDSLTGEENLRFFARMYDLGDADRRIRHVLERVGLVHRRHDPVRTYSRGMVQRLAIARAILHDPPVLLLDEPDTGLDQQAAEMLHRLIRQLGGEQRTVIFTTHNLERGVEWADRVALLIGGRITLDMPRAAITADELRDVYHEQVEGVAL
ncbi:MAG: heme ABC exporter ATP-binding protein CcmA [Chloroflexi bacterium]|nr:heme ABC exporter ATP-binding protein CcmA [Chloroflexota bacterium]